MGSGQDWLSFWNVGQELARSPVQTCSCRPWLSLAGMLPALPLGLELYLVLLEVARVTSKLLWSWGTSFPRDLP